MARRIALWVGFGIACVAAAALVRGGSRWLTGTASEPTPQPPRRTASEPTPAPTPTSDRRSASNRRSGRDRRVGADRRRDQSIIVERIGGASNRRSEADRRSGSERRSAPDRRRLTAQGQL